MKRDTYIYPAILTHESRGISIIFPDLDGCLPCGLDDKDAIKKAHEAMALHLFGMEEDGFEIPNSTSINNIVIDKNQEKLLIEVDMVSYRKMVKKLDEK